ncbi:hypothetical protein [uncultured Psychroserpens sp.]|uniref:hypothetical protein n=1 Tax=uncultured Psychroserpens sp. TaxID=255436 RepID=UPI00261966F4|nr:hypothetical protein [uncultured Psychroserpens sp.]
MKLLLIDTAAKTSYLDSLIGAAIILLVLSLINEKIVDFIRKYVSVKPKYNPLNLYRNINAKTTYGITEENLELKYQKKKEISSLAILVGIIVALFSKASLFDMLSSNPQDKLFWPDGLVIEYKTWFDIPKFILGVLFTGFFLSFGSKFFHDLLDMLYQTKEYKRKILNKQLYEQENASDVSDFIKADSHDLAKKALAENGKELKEKYPSLITSLEIGNTVNDQIGIIANVNDNPPTDFPKYLTIKLESGKSARVEIETIINFIADAQYGLECRVRNRKKITITGAFGGVLLSNAIDDTKYFLTCSHVALSGSSKDKGGFSAGHHFDEDIQILGKKGRASGHLIYAKLDENNDTAIVKLDDDSKFNWSNILPDGNILKSAISIAAIENGNDVAFYSSKKKRLIKGKIHKKRSKSKVLVRYRDTEIKSFFNVIVVGDNFGDTWSSISVKGDSGSILFDSNYRPFGLIIAGGNNPNSNGNSFTYAIPIKEILDKTNTKIYQP